MGLVSVQVTGLLLPVMEPPLLAMEPLLRLLDMLLHQVEEGPQGMMPQPCLQGTMPHPRDTVQAAEGDQCS